jgi:hypothetical protein
MPPNNRISDPQVVRSGNLIQIRELKTPWRVADIVREVYRGRTHDSLKHFVLRFPTDVTGFPNVLTPLATIIQLYRDLGLRIEIEGGSSFIGFRELDSPIDATPERVVGSDLFSHIWRFNSTSEVNALVAKTSSSVAEKVVCSPGVLDGLGWCLYEVMDNVLRHAEAKCGFFSIQVHQNGNLAISVCDSGIGILASLRPSRYRPKTALDAISLAVREGVTRDEKIGQGNGLYGLFQIVVSNKGILGITSGSGSLRWQDDRTDTNPKVIFPARQHESTFIDFQIHPQNALKLAEIMPSFSPIDLTFEERSTHHGDHVISVRDFGLGVGTREAGQSLRNVVINALQRDASRVVLDFNGIAIVSSSFADELVGMLFIRYGVVGFNTKIALTGLNEQVRAIVDRSVSQRVAGEVRPAMDGPP